MAKPKPFHEAIVDEVNGIAFTKDSARESAIVLASLANLTLISEIPGNHGNIEWAFDKKAGEMWSHGIGPSDKFRLLSEHIAAEAVRVAAEKKREEREIGAEARKLEESVYPTDGLPFGGRGWEMGEEAQPQST